MKILTTLLSLILCLALCLPCAGAEAFVYGEITDQLVGDAWDSGKLLSGDLKLSLDLDAASLGLTGEDAEALASILALLESVTLSGGVVNTENGLRLQLAAQMANANGGDPIAVDGAAEFSPQGIELETSLLETQKVTAKWETLLALAGLSDEDIEIFLALRDMDWEATIAEVMVSVEEYAAAAMEALVPYGEVVTNWAATLTVETQSNVAGTDGYPDAAQVTSIYLTQKDVGNLLAAIADQLEKDETFAPLLDMAFAESGENMTTAELCDEMRSAAADMTDTTSPIVITIGKNDEGVPLYLQVFGQEDDTSIFFELVCAADETGAMDFLMNMLMLDGNGSVTDCISLTIDGYEQNAKCLLQIITGGQPLVGMEFNITTADVTTAEGKPGKDITVAMTMNAEDAGVSVQAVSNSAMHQYLTTDGGEAMETTDISEIYTGNERITSEQTAIMRIAPTADGFAGTYTATQKTPQAGINSMTIDTAFRSSVYDGSASDALTAFALDTATSEDMDLLLGDLTLAAQALLIQLMQALPAEVLNML